MKKFLFVFVISLQFLFGSCCTESSNKNVDNMGKEIIASSKEALVSVESGVVAGYIDDGIYIYKGIPYATAERFMPPTKVKPWQGIRKSRAYGPTAPQEQRSGWRADDQAFTFDWRDGFQGEDCQVLNIWTKGINDGKKRPVMVWLHGGGFTAGAGDELPSYDGKNLAEKGDVVVVTLNHRLNVLGFLDLSAFGEKYAKSGNVGILDIIAALEWVNINIDKFGGDPSNVTIFGQSGGGGKVSTLLASPNAKGLFSKAIVQSGSMLNMMESKYSKRIGIAVVEELKLNPNNLDEIKNMPYSKLIAAGNKAVEKVKKEMEKSGDVAPFIFGWSPVVDGVILPYQPGDKRAIEFSKNIPTMIGTTLKEFGPFIPYPKDITIDRAKEILKAKYADKTDLFIEKISNAYPSAKPIDYLTIDYMFRPGAVAQANARVAAGAAPVFMYIFSWESPILDGSLASVHCMEIAFAFNNIDLCRKMTGGTPQAYKLADIMSSAWINFAKGGNPLLEEWNNYTLEDGLTYFFDNECYVKSHPDKEVLDLVNSFPVRGL